MRWRRKPAAGWLRRSTATVSWRPPCLCVHGPGQGDYRRCKAPRPRAVGHPPGRSAGRAVGGMVDAVAGRHLAQVERIDALQAGDVEPVLVGVRAPLVVGVDAAYPAEPVARGHGVELV